MRGIFIFTFLFIAAFIHAQDLTGIWRGHFRSGNDVYQRLLGDDDRYKFEVQIAQHNKTFEAVTYSYKTTVFYGKADADGTVNQKTKKVLLREMKLLEVRMVAGDACSMTCFLQYSKIGDEEFLEGTFTSTNTRDSSDCGRGTIFLRKVQTSDFFKEPFLEKREKEVESEKKKTANSSSPNKKNITPASPDSGTRKATTIKKAGSALSANNPNTLKKNTVKPPVKAISRPDLAKSNLSKETIATVKKDSITRIEKKLIPIVIPKVLASRANELVRSITVNTTEIELNIYDNGTIDNDTVSVYFDKKLIVSNARLTAQAIVVKLHLDETSEFHEVTMVAENEGDIPPNTSLMVVKAGDKEYEVHITSTEQKNAVVIFKYEKPNNHSNN